MGRVVLARLLVVLAWVAAPEVWAAVPAEASGDHDEPHDLADMALVAGQAHRYGEAAALLDRAFEVAPHPLYRLGAGEAYLDEGDVDLAAARLRDVLEATDLPAATRARAHGLLVRANAAAPFVAKARAASPATAAAAWEDASEAADVGAFLVQAAAAWETARRFERAADTYARALARDDLPADLALNAAAGLTRVRAVIPPPPPGHTAAWITTGTAAAALVFAGGALIVSDQLRADLDDDLQNTADGVVIGVTRADAQRRAGLADSWQTAAWIGLGTAAVLAVTSLVLFEVAPDEDARSAVQLRATASPDGLVIFAGGSL